MRFLIWLLKKILIFILIIIIFTLLIIAFGLNIEIQYHYDYVDLDDNVGIAKECSYKFEGYRKGGQGSPVCELSDGTIIQVKQYKYIEDGKCDIFKDVNCEVR